MFPRLFGGVLAVSLLSAACGHAAPDHIAQVELRDVVARVSVITEARSDVKVTVLRTNDKAPLYVTDTADGVLVEGHKSNWLTRLFGHQVLGCRASAHGLRVSALGVGDLTEDQMPSLLIRMPLDARISSSGALVGSLPSADSLQLRVAGCDLWTIGQVKGRFDLRESGTGRTRAGDVGSIDATLAGSGDLRVRSIADGLKVHASGSGAVKVTQVSGPIDLDIAGQGYVRMGGGHAPRMAVDIAGIGGVTYGGVTDRLDVKIAGQGDVRVGKVDGPITKAIAGEGSVTIGPIDDSLLGVGSDHAVD